MATWHSLHRAADVPSEDEIAGLDGLVRDTSTSETQLHAYLAEHPSLLASLGLQSFVSEFCIRSLHRTRLSDGRIDVVGLRYQLRPVSAFIELKGPNEQIVKRSDVSDVSAALIEQLRQRVTELIRPDVIGELENCLRCSRVDLLGPEFCAYADARSGDPSLWMDADISHAILLLQRHGCELIAVLGRSTEFETIEGRANATKRFAERGCRLVCFDDLVWAAEQLRLLIIEDSGVVDRIQGMLVDPSGNPSIFVSGRQPHIRRQALDELVFRALDERMDVCLIGRGQPPLPDYTYSVNLCFDVRKTAAPPEFLGGEEILLWAGQWRGRWLVAKWRVSPPGTGGIVWYEFGTPTAPGSIVGHIPDLSA